MSSDSIQYDIISNVGLSNDFEIEGEIEKFRLRSRGFDVKSTPTSVKYDDNIDDRIQAESNAVKSVNSKTTSSIKNNLKCCSEPASSINGGEVSRFESDGEESESEEPPQAAREVPKKKAENVGSWIKPKRSPYCSGKTGNGCVYVPGRNKWESPYVNEFSKIIEDPEKARIAEELIRKEQRRRAARAQEILQKKNKKLNNNCTFPVNDKLCPNINTPIKRENMDAMEAFLKEIAIHREHQFEKSNKTKNCKSDLRRMHDDPHRGSKILASLRMEGLPTESSHNIEKYKPKPYW